MTVKDVPVLLITGYLGSGKTTLLNNILNNRKGIRFAVIVNDIGEVNIDADLIQHGGVVNQSDDSLVALQNGCICCTLQTDLIDQLYELLKTQRFDYIVIEASGVCDPLPIAQTLCSFPRLGGGAYNRYGHLRLDCVATVVDALRMRDEFNCADDLKSKQIAEDDIENLLIQQIEFCNLVILNKVSEVSAEDLERIRNIVRVLQPRAGIIECDYSQVDLDCLVHSEGFDFNGVASSAGWLQEITRHVESDEHHHHDHHDEEHCHHHDEDHDHEEHDHDGHDHGEGHDHCHHGEHCHHHHHHGEGETEEYGIGTYVYFRRRPFDKNNFDYFVTKQWPRNIIRAKGLCYFEDEFDLSYIFEQAGSQKQLSQYGYWYATMPKDELQKLMDEEPGLVRDWDARYGDRMQKIVFIGQNLDREGLAAMLDECLVEE